MQEVNGVVLLYRVRFQASCKGSHIVLGITADMSTRSMVPEPTNQTKVSLAIMAFYTYVYAVSQQLVM